MAARFDQVKFNLMRAIEIFQDLNDADMDVTAPPSSRDYFKETQVANKLNDYLAQLIEEGMFEDCEPRDGASPSSAEEENYTNENEEDISATTPESGGFDTYLATSGSGTSHDGGRSSRESLTHRFKRYVQRILPRRGSQRGSGSNSNSEGTQTTPETGSQLTRFSSQTSSSANELAPREYSERESRRRTRDSRPLEEESFVSERSISRSLGSEPYDPNVVYEHRHRHKHNHPGSHHHHEHSNPHAHTYHTHASSNSSRATGSELQSRNSGNLVLEEDEEVGENDDYDGHGLSGTYQMETDDDLSSGALASRATTRSRSRSSRRNNSPGRRSSRSVSRSSR